MRLYPLKYRYLDESKKFKKYQWIEVEVEKHTTDPRPESHRPFPSTITPIGQVVSTKDNWLYRRLTVLKKPLRNMCEFNELNCVDCSLGIIRVRRVKRFYAKPVSGEWSEKQKAAMAQGWLEGKPKKIECIPFEFRFSYLCDNPTCRGHNQSIIDWELGELYLKSLEKYGNKAKASETVVEKMKTISDGKNDLHFFIGTVYGKKAWVLLGMFYPKKVGAQRVLPI